MIWPIGGILLWLGGWWFTGRLFGVYTKAIYLEALDRRHRGLAPRTREHHPGAVLFVLFDLGLLLLGMRSIEVLREGKAEHLSATVSWSILVCVFLFREGQNLHRFYHERCRALTGQHLLGPREAGTLRAIWHETSPRLRVLFLLAPLLALVPLATAFLGLHPEEVFYIPGGEVARTVLWLFLPQALLGVVLALPLLRLRRHLFQTQA